MGDTLPHAVRVGIIRTKQKGVFMHPTPSFCQKMPPHLVKTAKNFSISKRAIQAVGKYAILIARQERWNQKWTI